MKTKIKRNEIVKIYRQKILATSVAAVLTGTAANSVTQASDIDIYQEAKSGEITLMFMLDISGSMSDKDGGSTSRIDRLKTAMKDLLNGNTTKNIQKISDDKVIGLSTLGVYQNSNYYNTGAVLVPARRLDCKYGITGCSNMPSNGKTQREILVDTISGFSASTNTPTARSYAETVAYLMGRTTASRLQSVTDMPYYQFMDYRPNTSSSWTRNVRKCTAWNTSYSSCSTWSGWSTTENLPALDDSINSYSCTISSSYTDSRYYQNKTCYDYTGWLNITTNNASGFTYSKDETKNTAKTLYIPPTSLTQNDEIKKCSGQGIYILTDGEPTEDGSSLPLMQGALGVNGQTFTCNNTSYDCLNNLALNLLDPAKNPASLKFKTAVVGFGSSFNNVQSYDKKKTQQQNIDAVKGTSGAIDTNVKRAAYWGIIGEGGWYSGNSSQDVVDSVNAFLGELGTDIPAVTTGSPTVPKDSLNPAVLQKEAYFPQFQPTPDKAYQLWAGNMKKYNVVKGELRDKSSNKITDSKGRLIDNYDEWSPAIDSNPAIKDADENTYGSIKYALKGGAWSQLKLKMNTTTNTDNRKLLTNRIASGTGSAATFVNSTTLRQVKSTDLTDTTYKYDKNRGYLMQLLGYAVDPANPTITTATPELRQIGAVMHSSPLLITNKGKVTYTNGIVGSSDREDYILFGTTQGLLHVVDKNGQEKFAFVPNEMVEKQKEAFLKYDTTSGGVNKLFYGIDAPWTTYTEYVIDSSKKLTVNKGIQSQEGKQIAYGGLRMGGRSYYALNLQDIDNPKLLFQISPDDQKVYYNGSSKTFSPLQYMGQSWSKPTITWVKWGNKRKRVMFIGGGYDMGYESDSYNQTNKTGGGVYMFDAENGDLLWWASANATNTTTDVIGVKADDLKYSVVSEIRAEDRNGDGLADHLYFGDLGGQLFRIDLDNTTTSNAKFAKTPRRLLNLNAVEKSPRFYEMPAFSIYAKAGKTFAVISIGSGNRSLPLKDYTVGTAGYDYDAVYNIYDRDVTARNLYKSDYTFQTPTLTKANLGEVTQANRNNSTTLVAPYPEASSDKQGWYYRFQSNKLQSAKVFSTPIVLNYRLFVATFDGSKDGLSGDCGAGVKGESFLNQFCMPYGQCEKEIQCSSGEGCSLGAGIQDTTVVDNCDPTKEKCDEGGGDDGSGSGGIKEPKPEDGTNNKNYCISTGNRAVTTIGGLIAAGSSKMCLIPQRWYERSR